MNPDPIPVTVSRPASIPVIATGQWIGLGGGDSCSPITVALPTGVPVSLRKGHVNFFGVTAANNPAVSVNLRVKTDAPHPSDVYIPVPVNTRNGFGGLAGNVDLEGYVVKANTFADAAVGDVFALVFCAQAPFSDPSAGLNVSLLGTRTP